MIKTRPKLGQMLVDAGLLKPEQLAQAVEACAAAGERLGEYLCSRMSSAHRSSRLR